MEQGVLDVVKVKYWSFIPRRGSGRRDERPIRQDLVPAAIERARDGDSRPTGQRLRRPQRGAARLWEPEHLRTAASIIATYLSSHTPSRRLPLKMLLTRQSAIRLPAGNAAERYRPTRLGKPAGCSFIEPHLFHAPAVVDRVDLNSDALDVGVPAGRRAVVVD